MEVALPDNGIWADFTCIVTALIRHPHLSRHGNRIIEAEATALAGRTPQEDLNGLLRREWACRSGTDYLFQ